MEIWKNGGNGVICSAWARWGGPDGRGRVVRGRIWSVFAHQRLSGTAVHLFWVMVSCDFIQTDVTVRLKVAVLVHGAEVERMDGQLEMFVSRFLLLARAPKSRNFGVKRTSCPCRE